jgi:plasmid stability protein
MKMIQIRNVPDDLHRALKVRAAQEGTTLSELILRELPRIAHRPSMKEILARIATHEPVLDGPSPADIIRAERDARDARH